MTRLFAPPLQEGNTIALVVPAGPCDRVRVERGIEWLHQQGFRTKSYHDLFRNDGYLAGNDELRADELNQAFADPEVSAIFPVRGGYGVMRILDRLNYNALAAKPKIVAGFSDITALHLAIHHKTRLVTFHSPHPQDGYGREGGMSSLTERTYRRAFFAEEYDTSSPGYTMPLTDPERQLVNTLIGGTARGQLTGGNLALVAAMIGTPYEIQTAGKILFLEDIDEPPYRIDRFLAQLELAGKLQELSGVVLGQFTDCEPVDDSPSLTLEQIFDCYFAKLGVPLVTNYPTGHTRDNATLPLEVEVELRAETGTLVVLENPVAL